MSYKRNLPTNLKGLSEKEVNESRQQYGRNEIILKKENPILKLILDILKEPMLILLIAVAIIYFIMGQTGEAWFMIAALFLVSGISFYQENRSQKAIDSLKNINEPLSKVIRNGEEKLIPSADLVVNDLAIAEEGSTINADGVILYSSDFSVNESALTGEAYSVIKSATSDNNQIFSGTLVVSGLAIYRITHIGELTQIGKLASSLHKINEEPTPLQTQISKFIKGMAIAGFTIFLLVWLVYFLRSGDLIKSLLKGLTLAMSILPEEIPVAFTTFMALGSWRMMQSGILVKKTKTVETLGSATVICTDKTGTLTENKMSLQAIYSFKDNQLHDEVNFKNPSAFETLTIAMWSSEPVPFDPMEKSIHLAYENSTTLDERLAYHMVHEYPLDGTPPMMTHIFENSEGKRIIAAKGAPEAIIEVSELNDNDKELIRKQMEQLAQQGYRLLGVAYSDFEGTLYPEKQQQLPFQFLGLVIFNDPPKANINEVIQRFYQAGIDVKIVTGDNLITTGAIARKAGFRNVENAIEGNKLITLDNNQLLKTIKDSTLMCRMFPEAKLAVVNALKKDNQIVAMVGDGVNDAPALKSANIGVAMGKKGTETAKKAADIILVTDDLSKMVEAIANGRRIYINIRKAIQYIVSIHIPIILTISLPLFLGWQYPDIFTPVHVIFLELIMGPMCSIVYENEPLEPNVMQMPPRKPGTTFLSLYEMSYSIIQGLAITAGILFVYQLSIQNGGTETLTRTLTFTTLVFSNILISLANRSFYYSVFTTLFNKNRLMLIMNITTLILLGAILYIPAISNFFQVEPLSAYELIICLTISAIAVFWTELWKLYKRNSSAVPY